MGEHPNFLLRENRDQLYHRWKKYTYSVIMSNNNANAIAKFLKNKESAISRNQGIQFK